MRHKVASFDQDLALDEWTHESWFGLLVSAVYSKTTKSEQMRIGTQANLKAHRSVYLPMLFMKWDLV